MNICRLLLAAADCRQARAHSKQTHAWIEKVRERYREVEKERECVRERGERVRERERERKRGRDRGREKIERGERERVRE